MGNRRDFLIREIVDVCHKMDRKGFVANHDGNVSVKFDGNLLATPTAEAKSAITEDMIITLDMQGKKVRGIGNPFSEIKLHIAAYQARPDSVAVVHAHSPFLTARGLVGLDLISSLPEAVVSIGKRIPVAPFVMPGATDNDDIISQAFAVSDVIMLAGNGVLAIGDDLEQAWLRLELAEHLAKIDFYAQSMGKPMSLQQRDVDTLVKKRNSIGLGPQARNIASPKTINPNINFEELVASEVRKALTGH